MDATQRPARPTKFRQRLAEAEGWTPELREYAIRYLIDNTIQPGAMAMRELAGIEERTPFKTEIAPLLVDRLTPHELLEIWDRWQALEGNYMAVALGAPFSATDENDPGRGLKLPSNEHLPARWHGHGRFDVDVLWAKVIGIAARNWMEDLHVHVAFSDAQAPTLNRAIRNHVYEVLVAWRRCDPRRPADRFAGYLKRLATAGDTEWPRSAITGAIARAIRDFAAAEAIDETDATQLQEKAVEGAQFAVGRLLQFGQRRAQDEVAYLMTMIPEYWEEPDISPEFAGLLIDAAKQKDG